MDTRHKTKMEKATGLKMDYTNVQKAAVDKASQQEAAMVKASRQKQDRAMLKGLTTNIR